MEKEIGKGMTLDEIGEMLGFIVEHMASKDDLKSFATKDDLKSFATKDDLKAFPTKDDLRRVEERMATKEDLKRYATKDDLKGFATKDDLKAFATKDDLKGFATKEDIWHLEEEMRAIRGDVFDLSEKVENVIGFRKEIDHVLERTGRIEKHMGLA